MCPRAGRAPAAKPSSRVSAFTQHRSLLHHHQLIMPAPRRAKRDSTRAATQQSQQSAIREAERPKDNRGGWQAKRQVVIDGGNFSESGEGCTVEAHLRLATRRLSDLATRQCQRPQVGPADTDASPGPPVTRTRARCLFAVAGDDHGAGCAGQQDSHPFTSSRGSPRGSPLKKVPRRAYGRLGLSVGKAKRLAVRMSASQAAGGAPRSGADSRSSPSASPNPKRRKTMQRQPKSTKVVMDAHRLMAERITTKEKKSVLWDISSAGSY